MTSAKRSILGLLCMSALGLCAFAAFAVADASATTMHQCLETKEGTGTKYTDSTCSVKSTEGKWETKTIGLGQLVGLTPTLTPTAGTEETHAVLRGILHGIAYEITCTGIENGTIATKASNVEEATKMRVTGTGSVKFTGCSTKGEWATLGCTVPASIETVELTWITIDEAAEVMKVEYKPTSGTTLAGIAMSNCTGAASILNGTQNVKGHADATRDSPTMGTINTGAGELTFGGAEAHLTATTHWKTISNGTTIAFETP
jgi:hypothetical protein